MRRLSETFCLNKAFRNVDHRQSLQKLASAQSFQEPCPGQSFQEPCPETKLVQTLPSDKAFRSLCLGKNLPEVTRRASSAHVADAQRVTRRESMIRQLSMPKSNDSKSSYWTLVLARKVIARRMLWRENTITKTRL